MNQMPGNSPHADGGALKRRIAQALVAAPGIILLFLALHEAFADYRHMQEVKRRVEVRTAVAAATIVETHTNERVHGSLRIAESAGTFSFTTVSGHEVRIPYRNISGSLGTKLTVHYDPRNPENCAPGDNLWSFSDQLGNAPLFIMGLYFLFLAVKLGRRNA